ncbi:MAG: diphthine--ammonia ligase [Candidatus Bathyarchaeia archaeon]
MPKVVASWSGGKESCLACYKAISEGFTVSHLLNFIIKDRLAFHGNPKLIYAQLQAIEIPFVQREITWNTYEKEFKNTINELKRADVDGAVFGDIHLQEHRDWIERVCGELDIKPYFPLWHENPERILSSFVSQGFEATVVSVKANLFGKEWLGRRIDRNFIKDLCKRGNRLKIDLCGEFGEYHTFVINGPLFKRRLRILESNKVLKSGYWFLDVSRFEIIGK